MMMMMMMMMMMTMMMFMMMMMMNIKPANATETGFDEKAHFELFSTTVW